jgi:hypothetical protein
VSLQQYKGATTNIHIRFVFDTLSSDPAFTGADWYIDNFEITDRSLLRDFGPTMADDFSTLGPGSNWITEGVWTAVPPSNTYQGPWQYQLSSMTASSADYGGGVVTSNWVGNYWHTNSGTVWNTTNGNVIAWPGSAANIGNDTSVGEINFDYAADTLSRPFPNSIPQWAVAGILAASLPVHRRLGHDPPAPQTGGRRARVLEVRRGGQRGIDKLRGQSAHAQSTPAAAVQDRWAPHG